MTVGETTHSNALCRLLGQYRGSPHEEMQGLTQRRHATNGVDERCLDDLVQRKHVGIHDGHCGNKVDGLFGFNNLNKVTSRTAGKGLKIK